MKTTKLILVMVLAAILFMSLVGCDRDAQVASYNISKDADQFKVCRRIIFYNSITDVVMFEMIGNLSIYTDTANRQLEVTVKLGEDKYRKHFLGLSDNVTYIVEQVDFSDVSEYRYELVFKPESIVPVSIDVE